MANRPLTKVKSKFRAFRIIMDMTQEVIAEATGVPLGLIKKAEKYGVQEIPLKYAHKIAQYMNLEVDQLIGPADVYMDDENRLIIATDKTIEGLDYDTPDRTDVGIE